MLLLTQKQVLQIWRIFHRRKGNVILTLFSTLDAPKVVKMTTFGAAHDKDIVKMISPEIFIIGCIKSCQNGNFMCSQWRKFLQNDISVFCDASQAPSLADISALMVSLREARPAKLPCRLRLCIDCKWEYNSALVQYCVDWRCAVIASDFTIHLHYVTTGIKIQWQNIRMIVGYRWPDDPAQYCVDGGSALTASDFTIHLYHATVEMKNIMRD